MLSCLKLHFQVTHEYRSFRGVGCILMLPEQRPQAVRWPTRRCSLAFVLALHLSFSIGVSSQELGSPIRDSGKCATTGASFADALSAPHWNGWGVDSPQHRFQSEAMAQVTAEDLPRLAVRQGP
jgi:hypothetical protein